MFEPSEQIQQLYELLSQLPPELDTARKMMESEHPSELELAWLAKEVVDNTFSEYRDLIVDKTLEAPGSLHREYLYQTVEFLLEQGLNPNIVVDNEENVMFGLEFTDGPDVAAKVMRLLLEHGGNPNLYVVSDNLVSEIEFEIYEYRSYKKPKDEHRVQLTMVLQAYGGHWPKDNSVTYTMRDGYKAEIFKEFEKFDYRTGYEAGSPGYIHIFEKATGKTVADYL